MDQSSQRSNWAPTDTRGAVVVVGVDGSDTSWDAFWWACGEANRLGGQTVAVFVSGTGGWPDVAIAADCAYKYLMATERAEQLRRQVQRHAADQAIKVAFVHVSGDATTQLLRIAAAHRADQIVVGRSTKNRHQLAGSLGRRLVGKRKAPVVVVVP
jgi:K+-sensing histidine kinase KdpD